MLAIPDDEGSVFEDIRFNMWCDVAFTLHLDGMTVTLPNRDPRIGVELQGSKAPYSSTLFGDWP